MRLTKVLVTGGAGFIGSNLVKYLLSKKTYEVIVFDLLKTDVDVISLRGDINSKDDVSKVFKEYGPFETVFHLAAHMPDKSVPDDILWKTNVTGTANLITEAVAHNVKNFVFTSSNVAYGAPENLPVTEETPLMPIEKYGQSKARAEQELTNFKDKINIQMFRCPVVAGVGRLGLQAILFEFISENKNVYVLGDGSNKYQFVDVLDVCDALEKAGKATGFEIYNIGGDEILSLAQMYEKVILFAKSSSKVINLPKAPALAALYVLEKLNISPLGVYQYSMIGRSLYMDTSKLKRKLRWKPKKTNLDTFIDNYKWYVQNKESFKRVGSGLASSNRSLPKLGAFKILKALS